MDDFDSVSLVKKICRERNIPISRLEHDCGFSNGYIRGLREGRFPADRMLKISKYLNLSVEYLTTGEEPELDKYDTEFAQFIGEIRNDTELSKALPKYFELPDVKKRHVIELIHLLSET